MYVDSDILFLEPIDHLWAFLSQFNSSQLAAMAPEHEEPRIAWYNRFARHPFYGRTGINSGVMLMNMTRMRSVFFKVVLWWCSVFTGHKMSSFPCSCLMSEEEFNICVLMSVVTEWHDICGATLGGAAHASASEIQTQHNLGGPGPSQYHFPPQPW